MSVISESRKAIAAAVTGFGTQVVAASLDGVITGTEWIVAIATGAIAGAAVWAIPNAIPAAEVGRIEVIDPLTGRPQDAP